MSDLPTKRAPLRLYKRRHIDRAPLILPYAPYELEVPEPVTLTTCLTTAKHGNPLSAEETNIVCAHFFPTAHLVHRYTPTHGLWLLSPSEMVCPSALLVKWKHNRPVDEDRVQAMSKTFQTTLDPLDSMLTLSLNASLTQFEVIDGLHRWSAFKTAWLHPGLPPTQKAHLAAQRILCNVYFQSTEEQQRATFSRINAAVPVSDMYVDSRFTYQSVVEKVVLRFKRRFCRKTANMFTVGMTPTCGNTNPMHLTNWLTEVVKRFHPILETPEDDLEERLWAFLLRANDACAPCIHETRPTKRWEAIQKKCLASGCYLFLDPMESVLDRMEDLARDVQLGFP
jgi:hypothetical protein